MGINAQLDVIVIGGGINGTAIARDASRRGLKVLLLEKEDVGSATSAWSTRLIHGGLRYLQYGELHLVWESLQEREYFLRYAPHLVKPLKLVIPNYNARDTLLTRIGLQLYDWFAHSQSVPKHQILSRQPAIKQYPQLNAEKLHSVAEYYDAQITFPERLCLEQTLDAIQHGAMVKTHAKVLEIAKLSDHLFNVTFANALNPSIKPEQATAAVVINACGPWVDELFANIESNEKNPKIEQKMLRGTKGSHIIVSAFPGAPQDALYFRAPQDQRPMFIVPWNHLYLIGTTDIPYTDNPDHAHIDSNERDYLLTAVNFIIPEAKLSKQHIHYSYCGVRPLPVSGNAKTPGKITRRYFIKQHLSQAPGLFSIIGGKITTARSLGEKTIDQVLKYLHKPKRSSKTKQFPLPGAVEDIESFTKSFLQNSPWPEKTNIRLLSIYGVRAEKIVAMTHEDPSLLKTFDPMTGAVVAELAFCIKYEFAQTLTDVLMRRTMLGLNADLARDLAPQVAKLIEPMLGWDDVKTAGEINSYLRWIDNLQNTQKIDITP